MPNAVLDPGFEDGSSWTLGSGASIVSTLPRTGSQHLNLQAVFFGASQPISLGEATSAPTTMQAGITYPLSFYAGRLSSLSGVAGGTVELRCWVETSSGVFTRLFSIPASGSAAYTLFTLDYSPSMTNPRLRFDLGFTGNATGFIGVAQCDIDDVEAFFVEPTVIVEGLDLTVGDILNQVAHDAGDSSASFRGNARRWLNLTRQHIADSGNYWRGAFVEGAQLLVNPNSATDTYALVDANNSQVYSFISGDRIWDVTANLSVHHRTADELRAQDIDRSEVGTGPRFFTYVGLDSQARPQIKFQPGFSDVSREIRMNAYKQLDDLEENDERAIDPFFGRISDWGVCFVEGTRYFNEKHNNERGAVTQYRIFQESINRRKRTQAIVRGQINQIQPIWRPSSHHRMALLGLLDPSKYDNRMFAR